MTSTIAHTELHPALDTAAMYELITSSRNLWTSRQLHDLTTYATHHLATPLLDLVQYTPQQRWWTRLALTDGVELWLLSWLPGQHTAPHDHGGAAGSFTVLTGTLTEQYRYPNGPIRTARHPTHASIAFSAGRAHQITNLHNTPAASVHAYSPPLIPTRQYPTLLDIPNQVPALTAQQPPDAMSTTTLLERARAELNRVDPHQADQLHRTGALLIDIRPHHNRLTDGEIPGSIPIERIVLEWRLDPHGEHRIPDITDDTPVIVYCNDGYASSLAARDLKRIGLPHATDLIGGFRAWAAVGLPIRQGPTPAIT